MENNRQICGKPLEPANDLGVKTGDFEFFNCASSCGKYKVSRSSLRSLLNRLQKNKARIHLLGHFIRKMQGGRDVPYLDLPKQPAQISPACFLDPFHHLL